MRDMWPKRGNFYSANDKSEDLSLLAHDLHLCSIHVEGPDLCPMPRGICWLELFFFNPWRISPNRLDLGPEIQLEVMNVEEFCLRLRKMQEDIHNSL